MLTLDAPFHALWSRNSLSAGGFSVDDFAVDHANRAAICPGGITVPSAAPARRRSKRLAAAARCALTCRLSRDNSGEPMQFTNRIIRPQQQVYFHRGGIWVSEPLHVRHMRSRCGDSGQNGPSGGLGVNRRRSLSAAVFRRVIHGTRLRLDLKFGSAFTLLW